MSPHTKNGMIAPENQTTGVYIGLGSNRSHLGQTPHQLLDRALDMLARGGDLIIATSSLWRSDAWPAYTGASDYTNAVCQVRPFDRDPASLLARIHAIETELGRQRDPQNQWASRTMDLDLLDYNGLITDNDALMKLPHPKICDRDFVLLPLLQVSPNWVHPITCQRGDILLQTLLKNNLSNNCVRLDANQA